MSATPPELTRAPELLAQRYALLDVLGEGGMARVYRAYDQHLKVERAIKVVHPTIIGRQARLRLAQEAQLMARLAHPNVLTLFELGEDADRLFLVMELVEGGSVADRMAQHGPLPPRMAARVELGLLSALEFAHTHGVVHRDVKPHNILLDLHGLPRVTDFGIARFEEGTFTRTGAVLGTLAYMPPEQKSSARKVDARSDLYAAGATFYAMLTGLDPHDLFAAGFDPALANELLGKLPAPLIPWILRATSFRPADRFPDAAHMAAALVDAIRTLPEDPVGPPLVTPRKSAPTAVPLETSVPTFALETEVVGSVASVPAPRASRLGYALIAFSVLGLLVLAVSALLVTGSGAILLALVRGDPRRIDVIEPPPVPGVLLPVPSLARWEVSEKDGTVTAVLQARADVVDAGGAHGRPSLMLSCEEGKLRGQLVTGFDSLEISGFDPALAFVAVEIRTGEKTEGRMLRTSGTSRGTLNLTTDREFVTRLLQSPEVAFTYASSSQTKAIALFHPEDEVLPHLLDACL